MKSPRLPFLLLAGSVLANCDAGTTELDAQPSADEAVPARSLFEGEGEAGTATALSQPASSSFPVGVRLVGISAGSGAVVATEDDSQRYVPLGGRLTGSWRLVDLSRDMATFEDGSGARRDLALPRSGPDATSDGARSPDQLRREGALQERRSGVQLSLRPHIENDRIAGASVTDPIPAYPALKPGDVILRAFDSPVAGEEQIYDIAESLGRRERFSVVVERNGRERLIRLAPDL